MDKNDLRLSNDSIDRLLDFVHMRYEQESTRPNSLNTRISILITASTLFAAILGQLISKLPEGDSGWHIAFYIVLGLLAIPTIVIIRNLIYYFWGFKYGYPPDERDIVKQFHDLRNYFDKYYKKAYSDIGSKEVVLSRAEKWTLCEKLMDCVRVDHMANTSKSGALLVIGQSLSVTFILLVIAYVLRLIIGETVEVNNVV